MEGQERTAEMGAANSLESCGAEKAAMSSAEQS